MPTKQIQIPIQLGEPIEHRGVVIAPLFPRSRPHAAYLTLEEAPRKLCAFSSDEGHARTRIERPSVRS